MSNARLECRETFFDSGRHHRCRARGTNRIYELIRGPGAGNADLKIIGRKGRRPFGGIRYGPVRVAKREQAKHAAGLRRMEGSALAFPEGAEFASTRPHYVRPDMAGKRCGARPWTRGIGKNMQVGEGAPL